MKRILGRASYANVTATLALVVALGGTSYAAVNLPKDSVGTKQIINSAVKSADVKNDGLKGKDIKESSLAKVPSATNADQLGGKTLRGVSQWVHVDGNGVILSQSGGIVSARLAEGRYRVTFASDVSACGFNANASTAASANNGTNFGHAMVMVARSTTGVNDVQLETVRDDGVEQDSPFFLTAQC